MSRNEKPGGLQADIYEQLTAARNYLRTLDDFYARAAAVHNTTLEHYQVLLAVHCLGETVLSLRVLAEHLVRDHHEGPDVSRREHYEEWARIIESLPEDRVAARVEEFAAEEARHHFHVWELDTFLELLIALQPPADLEAAQATEKEFAVILRKNPDKRWPEAR